MKSKSNFLDIGYAILLRLDALTERREGAWTNKKSIKDLPTEPQNTGCLWTKPKPPKRTRNHLQRTV